MASLTRAKDWSAHPLGGPTGWPAALKTILGTVISNRFPMFIFWGPELYCFYNDAYRPSLGKEGKHPAILGARAEEAWAEIWPVIKPLIDQVIVGGGGTWSEDQLIPIYRNGQLEDVYWTFSYSPIADADRIQGVLVTCVETTGKMHVLEQLKESERQLSLVIEQAPVAVAVMQGPEHVIVMANSKMLELWGHGKGAVMNRPVLQAMPEYETQGFGVLLDRVYTSGLPYSATELGVQVNRNGELATVYVNFVYEPLRDAQGEVNGIMVVAAEVTETVLARQKAEAGEARFRLLADSMPQFVWTADALGTLNYFNRSVYDYSGLTKEDLKREGWLRIVHPEEREENIARWTDCVATGKDFLFEHRFLRNDGEYRWQLSRAVPLRGVDGRVSMWVGTSTDIQDMKQAEAQKDYFIGMASHELRNPLAALKSYLELLQMEYGEHQDALLQDGLKVMDRQITSLTHLVTGLLDVSKMRAGSIVLERSRFATDEMVRAVLEDMRRVYPEHEIDHTGGANVTLEADRSRIAQVLTNLLTNAVKYAPDSKHIEVRSWKQDRRLFISVRDHGIGISAGEQQRVFERFYRVSGRDEHTYPGFGIGLTLAADIVRLHDGDIGVTSEPGAGSTFWFALPIAGEARP